MFVVLASILIVCFVSCC